MTTELQTADAPFLQKVMVKVPNLALQGYDSGDLFFQLRGTLDPAVCRPAIHGHRLS
jgi:hypothetical protein